MSTPSAIACKRRAARTGLAALLGLALALAAPLAAQETMDPANAVADSADPPLDVQFIPTPAYVVERMLEMAGVTAADYLIDLGSGDGRIPIAAARLHGARALGVELAPDLVVKARAEAEAQGVADRVTFREQDLYEADISEATVLALYLLPSMNRRLRPRILSDMAPGTRVVAHQFGMSGWRADRSDRLKGRDIFLWIVPAKVEGRWRVEAPDGAFELSLTQSFQDIEGVARIEGAETPLRDARLEGADIRFTVEPGEGGPRVFAGRVAGDAMVGADAPGAVAGWRAARF